MSGKRAKRKRALKKNSAVSKKFTAVVCATAGFSTPAAAETVFSLSVFPKYLKTIPLGDTHSIENGVGAGAKLTLSPFKFTEFFAKGEYMSLQIPGVEAISLFGANIGAGYNIPLSDRFSLNLSASIGAYQAKYKSEMTGLSADISVGLNYKIRPSISVGTEVGAAHYSGGDTPLSTSALISPNITINLSELFSGEMNAEMNVKEVQPVFPVLHSWYEKNPFATIELENREIVAAQDVTVSFYQPQYMSQPTICLQTPKINADEKIEVPLTAFFNERMLDLIDMTETQAIVSVEWTTLGQKKRKDFPMTVPVYGRNNMSWDDDRKAASFVSSKDPGALLFAKYITGLVNENMRDGVPENMQKAMGIFDSLDKFGLSYVIDPSSAYSDNIGGASIDFLQFPYQTLMYRGGDCDDISILCCSLFEAIGIPTAFITIPGHIYMAFNSGITKKEAEKAFLSTQNLIIDGDEVWVPLEITLSDEGFNKAWRVGAREWRLADKKGEARLYKTHESWKSYPPVNVPGAAIKFTMPDDEQIASAFKAGINDFVERETKPIVSAYEEAIVKADEEGLNTTALKNTLASLYGKYGLFEKAEEMLSDPIQNDYSPSFLNMANLKFAQKDYETALDWYGRTLGENPGNALCLLGIARSCYELQKYDECDDAYEAVCAISPELAAKYSYLGAFENKAGRSFTLKDRLRNTIWIDDEDGFIKYNPDIDEDDEEETEEKEAENPKDNAQEEVVGLMNQITLPGTAFLQPDNIFVDTPERAAALKKAEEKSKKETEAKTRKESSGNSLEDLMEIKEEDDEESEENSEEEQTEETQTEENSDSETEKSEENPEEPKSEENPLYVEQSENPSKKDSSEKNEGQTEEPPQKKTPQKKEEPEIPFEDWEFYSIPRGKRKIPKESEKKDSAKSEKLPPSQKNPSEIPYEDWDFIFVPREKQKNPPSEDSKNPQKSDGKILRDFKEENFSPKTEDSQKAIEEDFSPKVIEENFSPKNEDSQKAVEEDFSPKVIEENFSPKTEDSQKAIEEDFSPKAIEENFFGIFENAKPKKKLPQKIDLIFDDKKRRFPKEEKRKKNPKSPFKKEENDFEEEESDDENGEKAEPEPESENSQKTLDKQNSSKTERQNPKKTLENEDDAKLAQKDGKKADMISDEEKDQSGENALGNYGEFIFPKQ